MDDTTCAEAVRNAWNASLPSIPFEPMMRWSEVGLNSLQALEFVFLLEQELGRSIGFDGMTPDGTAADLVRLLSRTPGGNPRAEAPPLQIFLVPGILGDEPTLAVFRRALSAEARFDTLELPDIESPARLLGDIAATAERLTKLVTERQPTGDIRLAGFSFGGLVAQEMAHQLEAKGRVVAFLAVLDGLLGLGPPSAEIATIPKSLRAPVMQVLKAEGWGSFRDRTIIALLRRLKAVEAARRFLLKAAPRHDPAWSIDRRRRLLAQLRWSAIVGWRPRACAAPTLLVTSEDFAVHASIETWREACPHAQVVPVPAAHQAIFDPPALAVLAPAFRKALAEFSATAA